MQDKKRTKEGNIIKTICGNCGFTLIEIIVVLVIAAILMSITVPGVVGYIRRAGHVSVTEECRQTVDASMLILSDRTSPYTYITADEMSKIKELSGADGIIISIKGGTKDIVDYLEYKSVGGTVVVYENGAYTVKDESSQENTKNENGNTENNTEKTEEQFDPVTEKITETTSAEAQNKALRIRDKDDKDHYTSDNVIAWESLKTNARASLDKGSVYRQGDRYYVCVANMDINTNNVNSLSEIQNGILIEISESTNIYTHDFYISNGENRIDLSKGDMKYDEGKYYICSYLSTDELNNTLYNCYYADNFWTEISNKYFVFHKNGAE